MLLSSPRIILGIDPGTSLTGYGILSVEQKTIRVIDYGVLNYLKVSHHFLKLKKIFEDSLSLIERYAPDEMSIESPFYGKNVQSMLKLGRAQGIIISAALYRGIPVFEYAPRKVKHVITGNGNASKEQVFRMLTQHLQVHTKPRYFDASDGLAVALCHCFQQKPEKISAHKHNDWKSFIHKNPGRIRRADK